MMNSQHYCYRSTKEKRKMTRIIVHAFAEEGMLSSSFLSTKQISSESIENEHLLRHRFSFVSWRC